MIVRLGFASAAALAALSLAAASHAQDARLAYGDLDLSQPAQAKVLDQRIERAAEAWCASNIPTGSHLPAPRCRETVRTELISALPASARSSYAAARASTQSASGALAHAGS